jgi:hypothetical protein
VASVEAAPDAYDGAMDPEYDGAGECELVGLILPAPGRSVFSVREVTLACLCFCVLIPSRIWFATAIDMPQKSGMR